MFALPAGGPNLYRAVDSAGDTIDFLLSSNRDAQAAKRFFQKALRSLNHPQPRVINVDGNPSYPEVITELRRTGGLGRRYRYRSIRYWNNIVGQDHRAIQRRVRTSQGFRSFESAWRTIQGIETMHMIRKGQVRWVTQGRHPGTGLVPCGSLWSVHGCVMKRHQRRSCARFQTLQHFRKSF